jgi:hypothetical protein
MGGLCTPAMDRQNTRYFRILTPAAHPRRSGVQQGVEWLSAAWTCRAGWVTVAPQGCSGGKVSGRAVWKAAEGKISKGILNAQRGEIHLRCAHVTYETTRDVVG